MGRSRKWTESYFRKSRQQESQSELDSREIKSSIGRRDYLFYIVKEHNKCDTHTHCRTICDLCKCYKIFSYVRISFRTSQWTGQYGYMLLTLQPCAHTLGSKTLNVAGTELRVNLQRVELCGHWASMWAAVCFSFCPISAPHSLSPTCRDGIPVGHSAIGWNKSYMDALFNNGTSS